MEIIRIADVQDPAIQDRIDPAAQHVVDVVQPAESFPCLVFELVQETPSYHVVHLRSHMNAMERLCSVSSRNSGV